MQWTRADARTPLESKFKSPLAHHWLVRCPRRSLIGSRRGAGGRRPAAAVNKPVVNGQLNPSARARATSSAAHSRTAGSSPTNGTIGGTRRRVGSWLDVAGESVVVVVIIGS
jgi:hypothetical protein